MCNRFCLLLICLIILTCPTQVKADVFYVDTVNGNDSFAGTLLSPSDGNGPKKTIKQGILAALTGDTVQVVSGTYTGINNTNLSFDGKDIKLESIDGAESCIIDCEGVTRAFTFSNGETANAVIDGFTVTNGFGQAYQLFGENVAGGMFVKESSPTIQNCIFSNCNIITVDGDTSGGAICVMENGAPLIFQCTFIDNVATNGGAVCAYGVGCAPQIERCVFTRNSAIEIGGAVISEGNADVVIVECTFSNNFSGWAGGAVHCHGSSSTVSIAKTTIQGNKSGEGGGLCIWPGGSGYVSNCTISGNRAETAGGGIRLQQAIAFVRNSILWGNFSDGATELFHEISLWGSSTIAYVTYCNIFEGAAFEAANTSSGNLVWYPGNVDFIDPGFVSPGYWDSGIWLDGNYQLKSMHGRWRDGYYPTKDLDNNGIVNFEDYKLFMEQFGQVGALSADFNVDSVVDAEDLLLLSKCWLQPGVASGAWVGDPNSSPLLDLGDPLDSEWKNELWPHGKKINMGAFGGLPAASMSPGSDGDLADINNDGLVDLTDLVAMVGMWLVVDSQRAEDLNRDGVVNLVDYSLLLRSWYFEK